jgi:alpha-glucosidase
MRTSRFAPIVLALATSFTGVASALENAPKVEPVPPAVRHHFKLAQFYQKYVSLKGFPILGSEKVSDRAMLEAAWILSHMLEGHPEVLKTLTDSDVRLVVMAYNEYTTDLPEQADMKPKDFSVW